MPLNACGGTAAPSSVRNGKGFSATRNATTRCERSDVETKWKQGRRAKALYLGVTPRSLNCGPWVAEIGERGTLRVCRSTTTTTTANSMRSCAGHASRRSARRRRRVSSGGMATRTSSRSLALLTRQHVALFDPPMIAVRTSAVVVPVSAVRVGAAPAEPDPCRRPAAASRAAHAHVREWWQLRDVHRAGHGGAV